MSASEEQDANQRACTPLLPATVPILKLNRYTYQQIDASYAPGTPASDQVVNAILMAGYNRIVGIALNPPQPANATDNLAFIPEDIRISLQTTSGQNILASVGWRLLAINGNSPLANFLPVDYEFQTGESVNLITKFLTASGNQVDYGLVLQLARTKPIR